MCPYVWWCIGISSACNEHNEHDIFLEMFLSIFMGHEKLPTNAINWTFLNLILGTAHPYSHHETIRPSLAWGDPDPRVRYLHNCQVMHKYYNNTYWLLVDISPNVQSKRREIGKIKNHTITSAQR